MTATGERGPRVKGLALRALDRGFVALRGEAARDAAIERMPADVASAFRYRTLLPASWYPLAWYGAILAGYRASTGEGTELCRQVGRAAARSEILGTYKMLIARLLSPQMMLSTSVRFFSAFFDAGTVEVRDARRGYGRIVYRGCVGWDENMWAEMFGACEAFLELAGAEHVRGRIVRGGRTGDDECEMEGRWV